MRWAAGWLVTHERSWLQSYAFGLSCRDVTKMNSHERHDAANEIRLLASVRHPNIIRCAAHTIS